MAEVLGHAKGLAKSGAVAGFGLLTGAAMMYGRAAVDKVIKPTRPVANFSVGQVDGLTVNLQNQAAGDSGWWDFGDGSALEPFTADTPASHTFAKPGTYSIKLLVRNFLMEENDRTVPVEVSAPATAAPNLMPKVAVTVEPVGRTSVAPATFRIKGLMENVERAFLDYGDKVELRTENGPFEQLVVIDKPGEFPIQLIGHSGKQVVKESNKVTVTGDKTGGLSFVLRVVDSGTRTIRDGWHEMVAVPAVKGAKTFEKVIHARPGFQLAEAKIVGQPKGVKGLTATVMPNKTDVKVAGEWADTNAAEAMVSLSLSGERTVPATLSPQMHAMPFDGTGPLMIPVPPQIRGMTGLSRKVGIELRQAGADGRPTTLAKTDDLSKPWTLPVQGGGTIRAELLGEQVKVSVVR